MPQLNPAPWFFILVFSWLVFLTILPQKILAYATPNTPTPQNPETLKTGHWNWLWQ